MKSRTWMWMIESYLFATLAMPVGITAQENWSQGHKHKHHQYRLVDMGTFGGAQSYNYGEDAQSLNSQGTVVGQADTSTLDPNNESKRTIASTRIL